MKKLIVSSAILLCIIGSSCKKEKSTNTNCDKTVASIAGTYSIVKIETFLNGGFQEVTSTFLESCELDDKLILNTNGTIVYKDLGTVCNPPGDEAGTWSISSTGKTKISVNSFDIEEAEINSFDCSTIVVTDNNSGGFGIQLKYTLKK